VNSETLERPPAERYAESVIYGDIIASKWVRKACERYFFDIERQDELGIYFDEKAADRVIKFFSLLKHSKGEWAGQIFKLEPWQEFVLWNMFGWKMQATDLRRFRTGYIEVGRKNGKSTFFAGIGLYLFAYDGEPGAEVYCAATKRDQAQIVWSESRRMVQRSPTLKKKIDLYRMSMVVENTACKFEPLGADEDTLDGLNPHAAIIDELHAHKSRKVWDILETASGSRRQPMQVAITTAGFDRKTVCWEQHEYLEKILDGLIHDETYFGVIYSLDEEDDWMDDKNWIKANPNLGISVKADDLIRKCEQAKEVPTKQNVFMRLHMNLWTESETRWLSTEKWNACSFPVDPEGLPGKKCYTGLDLSSTIDVSAFVHIFPPEVEGDKYQALCRFFIPQDNIAQRVRRDRVPYDLWVRQGWVTATPGNVIDYDFIYAQILADATIYSLQELAYDPFKATEITQRIEAEGIVVIPFRQGPLSFGAASAEMERLVLKQGIAHGGNPVLAWMMSNVVMRIDSNANAKPDKEKSREKIDGVIAMLMALDRAVRHADTTSVYESRGVLTFGTGG